MVLSKVQGGPGKMQGTAGRFRGNPVSWDQPCKGSPTSTVTPKELQRNYLPNLISTVTQLYEGWEGLGARLARWGTKAVIFKDQQSRQL